MKVQTQTLFLILASVLLSACAAQTAYKPADQRGAPGYTETRLGENRYRVTFTGNYQTHKETVQDYALLRAAELTLQEGHDWFRLVHRDEDKKTDVRHDHSGGFVHARPHSTVHRRCGLLSCDTVVVHRTAPVHHSGFVTTRTRDAYSTSLEIVMGKGEVPEKPEADIFDARDLASTLRRWMGEQRQRR